MSSVYRTVAPVNLAVDLDEALQYLRLDANELEQEGRGLIERATDYCQDYQWAQYITATFEERWDCWPCDWVIKPSKSPVQSVTSVQYVDVAGVTQTLTANTDYTADIYSRPARIVPAYGRWWPVLRPYINSVIVTYVAGYGDTFTSVPPGVRQAILMLANHWNEVHGLMVPSGFVEAPKAVDALLDKTTFRTFY